MIGFNLLASYLSISANINGINSSSLANALLFNLEVLKSLLHLLIVNC